MGVLTVSILQDEKLINPKFELLSMDILYECNRIPVAELIYIDGKPETKEFPLLDSAFFEEGKEIEIRLRYEGEPGAEQTVFKGIVLGQGLRTGENGCVLHVELSDKTIKMTGSRKSMVFEEMKDDEVIGKLITGAGLTKGTVASTTVTHKRLVQYHSTDWDFLMCRAEANSLLVSVTDGAVSAVVPEIKGSAAKTIEFGKDEVFGFELESDTRHQQKEITGSSWDIPSQALSTPASAKKFSLGQISLNGASVTAAMGDSVESLVAGGTLDTGEAEAWASAVMIKNRLSVLRGNIRVPGVAGLEIGSTLELKGMSKRFSGKTIVTGIRHQINGEGWFTDIQFGLTAERFASLYATQTLPAGGLLPGVNGLQIGIVEAFEADPDKEFRIKVKIPSIDNDSNRIWARMAVPEGGKERGYVFYPEAGDEVILGFFNDDPRQPVILGSMYSSVNTPPIQPADENPQKGITTRSGLKITFDDAKKIVTIITPGEQSIVIDDDQKTMVLKDANENSISLSKDGIQLESGKDVIINASKGNVKITAGPKVEISGQQVEVI